MVSIAVSEPGKLRIYLSDKVMEEMQTEYVDFDINAMSLVPCAKGHSPTTRKVCERQQFYYSGVQDTSKYVGKYKAVRHGNVWRLEPPEAEPRVVIPNPTHPYRISFPQNCGFVDGIFKVF